MFQTLQLHSLKLCLHEYYYTQKLKAKESPDGTEPTCGLPAHGWVGIQLRKVTGGCSSIPGFSLSLNFFTNNIHAGKVYRKGEGESGKEVT